MNEPETYRLRYQRLIDQMTEALLIDDRDGQVVFVNRAFRELFGLDDARVKTMKLEDYVAPDYHEVLRDRHERRVQGQSVPSTFEYVGLHTDGTRLNLEVSVMPVIEGGHLSGTQSVIRNLTERRVLERKVLRSEKMAALGLLAGGIAHDFNNLLTAIVGYPELIRTELPARSPAHEYLDAIVGAAVRASKMTEALLAFSRGRVAERVSVELNEVIREARPIYARLLPDDVILQLELDPQLPCVEADRSNLEQVLLNLVINARDALPEGGTICIATKSVERDGPAAWISITDTGTGMDPETAEQIFEPFFTTKSEAEGTGLGLSTVYGIVEEHGGHIDLDTLLGRGTTISITLPATEPKPASAHEPAGARAAAASSSLRILLVDDDNIVRTVAKICLEKEGHHVTAVVNGAEALELLRRLEFDCMVSDILMPVMSGAELKQALLVEGIELPTLWITGYSPEELRERFPEHLDHAEVLTKPFTPEQLLLEVNCVFAAAQ